MKKDNPNPLNPPCQGGMLEYDIVRSDNVR